MLCAHDNYTERDESTMRGTTTAGLAVAILLGLAACGASQPKASETTTENTEAPTTEAPTTKAPATTERPTTTPAPTTQAPTTTAAPVPPAPTDYTIALAVTRQQCFGSAGCNVTVRPTLSVVGVNGLNKAVSITYQIDGDESGPIIQTIDVTADGKYNQREVSMSTTGAEVTPTATITAVV